jgi:GNAT superfamily N-acetyltransferase
MTPLITWDTRDALDPADVAAVDAGLEAYNLNAADFDAIGRFGCFARSAGELIGGAVGRYWAEACELQQIWVREDLRRGGIGSKLVTGFEARARELGCKLLYLETFSFQAPRFYEKLGYEVACAFPGFPDGASKFLMQKRLT